MQGWVKLHRKLLASDVFQNEKLLKVFIYCLLKATHSNYSQKVGRQTVELKPGQFIYGRRKAALELNMKESTVRDYMNILKDDGVITISPTNKYSVVTIVNWELYQGVDEKTDNKNDNESDNKPTTKGQQKDTNKNDKNEKNDKNDKEDISTTTEPDPIVLFEQTLCRLSEIQRQKLIEWEKDFGGKREILNEAILIADNRNRRSFGFVEFLLKEWANNNLDSLERIRAYEKEKFKSKSYSKRPVRTEKVPDWFNARELPNKEPTELSPEEIADLEEEKRKLQERLKKYKNQEVLI